MTENHPEIRAPAIFFLGVPQGKNAIILFQENGILLK